MVNLENRILWAFFCNFVLQTKQKKQNNLSVEPHDELGEAFFC